MAVLGPYRPQRLPAAHHHGVGVDLFRFKHEGPAVAFLT